MPQVSLVDDMERPVPTLIPPTSEAFERTTERHLVALDEETKRPVMTVLTGVNAGKVFTLDKAEMFIGRGNDTDIPLDDTGVSRRHARVYEKDGHYYIEDLGSTNGTFVRSTPIRASILVSGDRIQVGPSQMLTFALVDDVEESLRHRLYEASTRDGLTRVYNRQFLLERTHAELAYARRHQVKLAALMMDIDHFKRLNDTYGHPAGDMVLKLVADRVQRLIRTEDVLARYGGEEFVVLARGTGRTQGVRLAERIRSTVERLVLDLPEGANGERPRTSVSIGVAVLSELPAEAKADALFALADQRLYAAKHAGRNRVVAE
jgi:diguanylate cyclase (GGDEF)-like protein